MNKVTFIVNKAEFLSDKKDSPEEILNEETSVSGRLRQFFNQLSEIGEIHHVEPNASVAELNRLCQREGTIYVSFYDPPPEGVACRLLLNTRGGLMLPGGFLGPWFFRRETVNLVQTQRQKSQLIEALREAAPRLEVFSKQMIESPFCFAEATEPLKSQGQLQGEKLIYAGRFIANKGILQTARVMALWPSSGATLQLVGNTEPEFENSQSASSHISFEPFFKRELDICGSNINIEMLPACSQNELNKLYHKADLFVCPSFHEDEALGNAAHEAVLSGLPAVVTDWSGLGQLGKHTRGGCVRAYPTLAGVRYSLSELRQCISCAIPKRNVKAAEDAAWIQQTFAPSIMLRNLQASVNYLLNLDGPITPIGPWRDNSRAQALARHAPDGIREAFEPLSSIPTDGLYAEGTGLPDQGNYSYLRLFRGIQSIYTTNPTPPRVYEGMLLRGFWRVGVWEEQRSIVEFGYPGPRFKRYDPESWELVRGSIVAESNKEPCFACNSPSSQQILQELVDLGYLVPDEY